MRIRLILIASALLIGAAPAALAADRVEFGPAPEWVRPVKLPQPVATADGSALRSISSRQQVRLEPGRVAVYSETALQILTPDGLKAGTVAVQWRPDKDEIKVHRATLLRAGKTIDLLADGNTFTILRREENLEQASLDGRLTAVLQPEGLQVGDILAFAMTITSNDPVMGRHLEFNSGLQNNASGKIAIRVEWPSESKIRYRAYDLPQPLLGEKDSWKSAEWSFDEAAPFVVPSDAPMRFQLGRRIEFTDFADWADIPALLAHHYNKAAVIPAQGPLRTEVERIRAASADPLVRASAALALVEDKVRYVALLMGEGDFIPANAETTWARRYGECKAKAALLTAILRELGIAAVPVAVAIASGDGLEARLAMVAQFNHVIVKATIGGRSYWLDGTRSGDGSVENLRIPFFHWGLPLVAGAGLERLIPAPHTIPSSDTMIAMDASRGGDRPAPTRIERIFRDDSALYWNQILAIQPSTAARDKALREYWVSLYPQLTITKTGTAFNRTIGEYRLTVEGDMKLDLDAGRYWVDVPTLGYKPDFKRDPGPLQKAPFALNYPTYSRSVQTILVPDEFASAPLSDASPIDRTLAGTRYRRTIGKQRGTFRIETSAQTLVPEIPYSDALAAEAELRKMNDDEYYVGLARPTKADTEKMLAQVPTSAPHYLSRGLTLLLSERAEEAILEFDKAIAIDPKLVEAFEGRGMAKVQTSDLDGANQDYELAAKLGSKLPMSTMIKAARAAEAQKWDEAITLISQVIEHQPENPDWLLMRAEFHRRKGDLASAMADSLTVTRLYPNNGQAYLFRINLLQRKGQTAAALAQADALLKLELSEPYGYVVAARTYAANGRQADAMRAFDRAIAIKPEGYVYVNRAEIRPKADKAGRLADFREGVKLDPDNAQLRAALGNQLGESGDWKGAMEQFDKAIIANPTSTDPRIARGIVHLRLGQAARAEADFAFVRAEAEMHAQTMNQMCWAKATAGLGLDSALSDCDRALALEPNTPAYHDSRALVLLRLGRVDDAIAAYDRALKPGPKAASLYGRALAWSRRGDKARALVDAAAAEKLTAGIARQFGEYGLSLKDK